MDSNIRLHPNGTITGLTSPTTKTNNRYRAIQHTEYPDRKPEINVWFRYINYLASKTK